MTTIIVTNENEDIQEFDFDADTSIINIGRRSTNEVCIPNLSVSGKHARITIDTSGALIEDLNSTNGTYINGRLISRQLLDSGDEIVIGKTRVRFETAPAEIDEPATKISGNGSNGRVNTVPPEAPAEETPEMSSMDSSVDEFSLDESHSNDLPEKQPMTLSQKARLALGGGRNTQRQQDKPVFEDESDVAIAEQAEAPATNQPHPLDDIDEEQHLTHDLDSPSTQTPAGAVIEIKNGAKSGQVLPIDKPVTTLGRPGIQIAAIMRKPDGYFLMHIESDESVDLPTLNLDEIGDEPVLLNSGDRLNVAGIEVEFMLS